MRRVLFFACVLSASSVHAQSHAAQPVELFSYGARAGTSSSPLWAVLSSVVPPANAATQAASPVELFSYGRRVGTQSNPLYINIGSSADAYAPLASPAFTGHPTVPTAAAGDSSADAANTEFVQNTLNAERGSVTGDLSASGSSLTLTFGTSGLQFVLAYSASSTASLSVVASSGTITPVDIYEVAAWGTTSYKGYTLDGGSITTTATVVDSTFYLSSNAWGTYHVGVGGHLYIVDIFGSGGGKRVVMAWRKVS